MPVVDQAACAADFHASDASRQSLWKGARLARFAGRFVFGLFCELDLNVLDLRLRLGDGGVLGPVDVQRRRMTVAAMAMKAEKLLSVLQQRVAMPLYSLSFPNKFSIRCRHL